MIAGGITGFSFYAPTYGAVQNHLPVRMRATAVGLLALLFGLFGVGLGPTVGGLLSDAMASRAFGPGYTAVCTSEAMAASARCVAASATGLRDALAILSLGFAIASTQFLIAGFRLRRAEPIT